ncbi:MAG TPA: RodZ domain-containing protein [Promineifilum sp.]
MSADGQPEGTIDARMDEIGHILREARENKGLTLNDVQANTKINARFLTALESGQYDALPTPVHVRGFLRNYARFLGLDPQPLLDRYHAVQDQELHLVSPSKEEISPENPLIERQDQPFFDPVNVEVNGKNFDASAGGSGNMLQIIIIVALVIALALIANRFIPILFGNGGNNAVQEFTTAVQEAVAEVTGATATPTVTPEATEEAGAGSSLFIDGTEQPIADTSRNNPGGAATPLPTRPPLPATLDEIRLKLDILERTWLEVTIDGAVVQSGIAKIDDTFEWTAQSEAKVVTGNAAGVFATINDIALGRLGGRGEEYEEVWRTTQ